MSCCSRKTVNSQNKPLPRPNETEVKNFETLIESLQIDLPPVEELRQKKNQILERPEWKTQARNRMEILFKETQSFANLLTDQIEVLSRGLKTEIIINTRLEDSLSKEVKSARQYP